MKLRYSTCGDRGQKDYGGNYMVKMSEHEEFLSADMVENGDLLTIVNEGKFLTADETPFKRAAFQIEVKLPNGSEKTWTMNKTTRKRLAAAYGDDSLEWVSKKVRVELLKQNVRGELKIVIYGHPVETLPMVEEKVSTGVAKTEPKLTEEEALKRLEDLNLTEEDKKKYLDNLRAAGLL